MRIGIVTSGGDAPGMNAAIRSVVRSAVPRGLEVLGFERGYRGLIEDQVTPLDLRSVGGIIHLGGTFLKTSRCPEFKTREGLMKGAETLKENEVDGLIVIGGGGSFRGAVELNKVSEVPIIGLPATIDNDVAFTDSTIGFDTAVNTCLEAIDRIRTTALSHERVFIVEVMGRDRGFIALEVGVTAGAGIILIPEVKFNIEEVCERLRAFESKGKASSIIVAAEGIGDVSYVSKCIEEKTGFEVRLTKLGYIQRGGSPTARSRLLADLFGARAVRLLLKGAKNKMVGIKGGRLVSTDLKKVISTRKRLDMKLYRLSEELAV